MSISDYILLAAVAAGVAAAVVRLHRRGSGCCHTGDCHTGSCCGCKNCSDCRKK